MEIRTKTDEAVAARTFRRLYDVVMTPQYPVCAIGGRPPKPPPRNMTGRLYTAALVKFDRVPSTLTGS